MSNKVVVIGAGGFGRETLDVLEASATFAAEQFADAEDFQIAGVADDAPSPCDLERLEARGVRYLGTTEDVINESKYKQFIIGVGSPSAKATIDERFTNAGWKPVTVVHPAASVGSNCSIGEGSVICSGVQLSTNTLLGRHVHLNPNSTIGHDAQLEDYVSVNPGAVLSGECVIKTGSLLGAGSVVLQGLFVGPRATVGASACVVKNVAPDLVVIGVPAKPMQSKITKQSLTRK